MIKILDLFCGVGGFSYGFCRNEKINLIAGIDSDLSVKETFENNHKLLQKKKMISSNEKIFFNWDLSETEPNKEWIDQIDIIIGSPPCQGFSDARGTRYFLDEKNDLIFKFYEWINILRPKIALMENVKGLITIGKSWLSKESIEKQKKDFMLLLSEQAKAIGYNFGYKNLDSAYYSVPQRRERVFGIFVNKDIKIPPSLPIPNNFENKRTPELNIIRSKNYNEDFEKINVFDAFKGLKLGKSNSTYTHFDTKNHYDNFVMDYANEIVDDHFLEKEITNQNDLEIIKRIKPGSMYRSDRFGEKHIPVWEVFKEVISVEDQKILKLISLMRLVDDVKTKKGKYDEGYVPTKFLTNLDKNLPKFFLKFNKTKLKEIRELFENINLTLEKINELVNAGWLKYSYECRIINENQNINPKNTSIIKLIKNKSGDLLWTPLYKIGISVPRAKKLSREGLIDLKINHEEVDLTAKAGHRGNFYKLDFNETSKTLLTNFTNYKKILHPSEPRGLTIREGARLMSFPDSFKFYGSFNKKTKHIGNSVPPLLAKIISHYIIDVYFEKKIKLDKIKEKNQISLHKYIN